jgi:hypothetical protein
MGGNDQDNGEWEEPELILVPYLLGQEEKHPPGKKQPGTETAMVLMEAMPERPGADGKRQTDHSIFKLRIFNDIHAQDGQGGNHQREDSAMNGA